jgi:hypothetical protein
MKNQTTMQTEPTSGVIALRAYEIWKTHGCPEGHDMEYWLQAEAELRAAVQNKVPKIVVSLNANPGPRAVRSAAPVQPELPPASLAGERAEAVSLKVYARRTASK